MTPPNCVQCGAPLPASLASIVVCRYCGREYQNPPQAAAPSMLRTNPGASRVFGVFGIVALGVALGAYRLVSGGRAAVSGLGEPASLRAPNALVSWGSTELTFFHGRGAALDLVGVGTFANGATALVAITGATGQVLWRAPSGSSDVYTDSDQRILRYEAGKTLTRYDALSGKIEWSVQLNDTLGSLAFGPRCASLHLDMSRADVGIDTDSGRSIGCNAPRAPERSRRLDEPSDVIVTRGEVSWVGGVRTDDNQINPAPPRLAVTAERGSQKLWVTAASFEPVWQSGGFDRSIAFTGAGAFLFGRSSSDHGARWALIDTTSGHTVYERQSAVKVESRVQVASGGDLVFVVHDSRLEAYAAATGELRWSIHRD